MAQSYFVFVGNPGTGKSTILNGIAGKVLFEAGISIGRGCTKRLQVEEVEGKGIFMDTPGLDDTQLRQQAAEAISEALKKTGNYRIFFVVTLEAGRIKPADVATIKIVTDALSAVQGVCYSIIINKLEEGVKEMLDANEDNCIDELMACLMGDDMTVKTSNIFYMERRDDLAKAKKAVQYELPSNLVKFIMYAPRVYIAKDDVRDLKYNEYAEMVEKFETQIKDLKGNLEEQLKVNARNAEAIEKQNIVIKESQEQAQKDREEFRTKMKKMEDDHDRECREKKEQHRRDMEELKKDTKAKGEELQKLLDDANANHAREMKAMQDKHEESVKEAQKNSDGGGFLSTILGAVPVVGPLLKLKEVVDLVTKPLDKIIRK